MKFSIKVTLVVLLALIGALGGGCINPQTHHYRYYNLELPGMEISAPVNAKVVQLRSVSLPEYLNRPQITTRDASTLSFAEFDRWAEPLDVNISRVLKTFLAAKLADKAMAVSTGSELPRSYDLKVNFERFEAEAGKFIARADFSLFSAAKGKTYSDNVNIIIENCPAGDFVRLCECAGQALEKISVSISERIVEIDELNNSAEK